MSTEVLIMRLSELTEDVTKVRGVLEQLRRRGSKLEELQKLVDRWKGGNTITVPLSRARQQAGSLENAVGENAMLRQMLEYADMDIRELVDHIDEAQQRLKEMTKIIDEMEVVPLGDQLGLSETLKDCNKVLETISKLRESLDAGTAPREVWAGLRQLHREKCRGLFADYVDLLSGMVLRDTELDDKIGAMTDGFLEELGSPRLVLPSRRSELPPVFKGLVKIGFPEWAIWDVPLAAHHAGLLWADQMLDQQPDWRTLLNDRSDDVRSSLIADIYATWRTGPAYVCAMLLLHLDPASDAAPHPGAATDHERARVISQALPLSQDPDVFTTFVTGIGTDWAAAIEQNTAPGAARYDTAALDDFAERVREPLKRGYEGQPYGAARWESARQSLQAVLTTGADEPYQAGLLDLLNAAWALRRMGIASPAELERRVKAWRKPGDREWHRPGGREGTGPPSIGGTSLPGIQPTRPEIIQRSPAV